MGAKGGTSAAYLRGLLEKHGKTELLAKVERGELSAHAAAVEAGFRKSMVQHAATVEGFQRAIEQHLSREERRELMEREARNGILRPWPGPNPRD